MALLRTFAALALMGCAAHQEPQQLILSPTEDTRELVERAAEAWSAATGIEIRIGAGGIPIVAAEQALGPDGDPVCGTTDVTRVIESREFIRIDRVTIATAPPAGCPGWRTGRTMLHEIGHILCEFGVDGDPENGCHTADGLMAAQANDAKAIDADALEVVCAHASCAWMAPQQENP